MVNMVFDKIIIGKHIDWDGHKSHGAINLNDGQERNEVGHIY